MIFFRRMMVFGTVLGRCNRKEEGTIKMTKSVKVFPFSF
jgi:hypothetical protein